MPKATLQCKKIHLPQTSLWNNYLYVRFVVFKLTVGQVSLQVPWFSPTSIIPLMLHINSFIRLSLILYNLCNCQLHYLLNTKINIIILNGSYSKMKGFQSHIRLSISMVLRYDACGSSKREQKCIHGFDSGTWRKEIS